MSIYKNSGITQKTASYTRDVMTLCKLLITFPLWLCVFLPLTIIGFISKKFFTAKKESVGKVEKIYTEEDVKVTKINRGDRKYDVVIYGCTGYTGFLCAKYLAEKYGDQKTMRWAIGGRSKERLEKKKAELAKEFPDTFTDCDIVIADSKNWDKLVNMCNNTKVVCTTVGPFTKYGSELVNACALMGTDYTDITGEMPWNKECHKNYKDMALKSGARLVSFCGHDCVPWDLVVYKCNQKLQGDHDEKMKKVSCFDDIRGTVSGGTIDTMFTLADERTVGVKGTKEKVARVPRNEQAYYMRPGATTGNGFTVKNKITGALKLEFDSSAKVWKQHFFMAAMNNAVVDRSNCLESYNDGLEYHEGKVAYSLMQGLSFINFLLYFAAPVMNNLVRKVFYALGFIAKPSEGASEEELAKGYLNLFAEGTGEKGTKVNCVLTFPVDPGYKDTARMLIECGACFALNNERCQKTGGFWTPASAFGDVCLERLCNTGSTFKFYNPRE